ncbi:hypothetical protein LTR84_012866 [Exophiala bonariae]|uniref:Ketoreductase (KR) domain-containing protein n=1 Tax=Exophiala bonariae TaxID=1690606 RepID=A0AAV9NGZ5_9EURO|nr:hypothetical protein LTR84_012866 [Exophiala bonariae]
MVNLDDVRKANSSLVQRQPLVAVFTGGTGGIGLSTLKTLAATHSSSGRGLRVYITGRNQHATEKIIADCLNICPQGDFRFIQVADLSLLRDVDRACEEIIKEEKACVTAGTAPKLDLLFMSQGELSLKPYTTDAAEGLEFRVSLLYYSRMKTILNLLPLLLESTLPAHIVSVFAAGKEGELHLDDLSMRDPKHQGVVGTRSHVTYMTTFFFEYLASKHPGKLSLVHVYPGLILTDGFKYMPFWFRVIWRAALPVLGLFCTSLEECGQRVLYLADPDRFPARSSRGTAAAGGNSTSDLKPAAAKGTDLEHGSGAYGVTLDGETIPEQQIHQSYDKYRTGDTGKTIVAHTLKAFDDIKAGKAFTG